MGLGGKILDFLFGKDPKIFNKRGEVEHKLPKDKWDAWQKRYQSDPEYNWRNHTGVQGGVRSKDRKKTNRSRA